MVAPYRAVMISHFRANAESMPPLDWSAFHIFRARNAKNTTQAVSSLKGKIRVTRSVRRAMYMKELPDEAFIQTCLDCVTLSEVLDLAVPGANGEAFLSAVGDEGGVITDGMLDAFFAHILKDALLSYRKFVATRDLSESMTANPGNDIENRIESLSVLQDVGSSLNLAPKHKRCSTDEHDSRNLKRTKAFSTVTSDSGGVRKAEPEVRTVRNTSNLFKRTFSTVSAPRTKVLSRPSTISAPLPSSLRRVPVSAGSTVSRLGARSQSSSISGSVSAVHRQAVYTDNSEPDVPKPSSKASTSSSVPPSESWVEDDLALLLMTPYNTGSEAPPSADTDDDATMTSASGVLAGTGLSAAVPSMSESSSPPVLGNVAHALINNLVLPSAILPSSSHIEPTLLDDTTVQLLSVARSAIDAILVAHQAAVAQSRA
ncbi:hypothetical protein F5890DRAFT_235476 [Lentinula detonsa]|uniref:Uncharacterized protein n=1 Tax=Lentinula detonsa TaxID=2804962 RepID=A0AA38PWR4_9AGAR|nr:hypothetical protein F5890DRAFT_235476 [Lentinula detonsa]